MIFSRLEQRQIHEKALVAVLLIEDSDGEELWLNCGALVYDQGMPNHIPNSRPPLIGTFFANNEALVVLCSHEGVVLNKSGICLEMVGPGDGEAVGNMQKHSD